jgi:hypothetical protein
MRSYDVVRQKKKLDELFGQIKSGPEEPEARSHWTKYLCILVSGFIESSIRSIYGQYASSKASPKVANFVGSRLKSFQNPRMDKILDLSGAFSAEWRDELDKAPDEAKSAVNSIVANRNRIAHGEDVSLTYGMMCDYYRGALKLIDIIDGQCKR